MYLLVLFCVLIVGMCATYLHEIRYVCTLYIYVPGTPSTEPGILLMHHSMRAPPPPPPPPPPPQITASLLDFLCRVNSNLLNTCSLHYHVHVRVT